MNVFQEERHHSSGPQGMCRDFVGGEVQSLTNVGSCGAEGICESRAQDDFKFFLTWTVQRGVLGGDP